MKKYTKIVSLFMVLTLALAALAGCSTADDKQKESQLTVIEAVDPSTLTLGSAERGTLKISFDSTKWHHWEQMQGLGIALTETWEIDNTVSVVATDNGETSSKGINEADLKKLTDGFASTGSWMSIPVKELRLFKGETVIYLESSVEYTEEYLNYLLESGTYTQEWVDENKEEFLNNPDTKQIQIYALVDGHLVSYIATYYDDAHKQVVLDAITVAIQTTEIL